MFKNLHAHQLLLYLFYFLLVFILYTTGFEGISLLFHEYTNIFSHKSRHDHNCQVGFGRNMLQQTGEVEWKHLAEVVLF